jgi:Bardet-Biedl syndrome 9 protein
VLRIFSLSSNATEDGNLPGFQASDLLMEYDFKIPILQVSAGLLLSATSNVQLAVLHPKKLSIYSISCEYNYRKVLSIILSND